MDPKHTALVMVDFQVDFCSPEGAYGRVGTDMSAAIRAAQNSVPVLEAARRAGLIRIFVRAIYDQAFQSGPMRETIARHQPPDLCTSGTPGAEFYLMEPQPGEYVVSKHRYSAFAGTDLDQILHANQVQSVVVAGVTTFVCVESTVRDAFLHDYYAVVLEDCVAARDARAHAGSLEVMDRYFGQVVPAADVLAIWERSGSRT